MLAITSSAVAERPGAATAFSPALRPSQVRRLARGETLFQSGELRRQLYRVERGALCHYIRWDDGRHEVIEFAFPGDIIGFGHLSEHASTAQAIAKTIVSPVSEDEFERLLDSDGQLAARYSAAVDREFDYLRARAVESGRGKPAKRVASFLAALSHLSSREGRDPLLITDELSSGVVADHLGMSLDTLAGALRGLAEKGIVVPAHDGLHITDIDALQRYADGQ